MRFHRIAFVAIYARKWVAFCQYPFTCQHYSGRSLLNSLRFRKMAFCYHDRFIARVGVQFKRILNRARPSVAPSINECNVAFGAVLMNVWLRTTSTTMTIIQIIDIGLTTQYKCLRKIDTIAMQNGQDTSLRCVDWLVQLAVHVVQLIIEKAKNEKCCHSVIIYRKPFAFFALTLFVSLLVCWCAVFRPLRRTESLFIVPKYVAHRQARERSFTERKTVGVFFFF